METKPEPPQRSLKWHEIWGIAFFHPTIKMYSQIICDSKASIGRGLLWMAITAVIAWFVGPQRDFLVGYVSNVFGLQNVSRFLLIGAPIAPIYGVITLLLNAGIAHGFARLFKGAGTFRQLVYGWGVIQLPFFLAAGLVMLIPSIFPSSREFTFSTPGLIIQFTTLVITIGVILYLFYAEFVAFSAVEKFGIGKGLGVLILLAVIIGIVGTCLSFGLQTLVTNYIQTHPIYF